jgi:biotin-(acetyl-CoA carboxylase) ligase
MSAALDLPPPYSLIRLRESGDAFARACAIAPEVGAGTLVQVGRFDLLEFAIVLEPDEPLRGARRALYAGMNALADALGSHAPPEKPVTFGWPDALLFDGGLVGGGRLGWPVDCAEDAVPDWLVFGAMLRSVQAGDPGLYPGATSLTEEETADTTAILESFARHLMWGFDLWQERGFPAVSALYLERTTKEQAGDMPRIDDVGDLVMSSPVTKTEQRQSLMAAMAEPSWLDPVTGTPKLGLVP